MPGVTLFRKAIMTKWCHAGAITSADPNAAQKDDAAYPPSKHARLHKDHTTPKSARVAARGGPAGRGGARGAGTRGKAKMLADESRFSRPHPLQVTLLCCCEKPSQTVSQRTASQDVIQSTTMLWVCITACCVLQHIAPDY